MQAHTRRVRLLAVVVLVAAGCARQTPGPAPATTPVATPSTIAPSTTVAPSTSVQAAPAPQPWISPPSPALTIQPGPHSTLGDVDVPAGSVASPNTASDSEVWRYSTPYDDTVAFLRAQFATGRKYDARGATWWRDLPPCYNAKFDYTTMAPGHESPPKGWDTGDSTKWVWGDGAMTLVVEAWKPGNTITPNGEPEIMVDYMPTDKVWEMCNRS